MKGLGKTGWMAEVEVELLKEGETPQDWRQEQNQGPLVPIVVELDAEGNASMNSVSFAPDRLRERLANVVATFGSEDPVILRPNSATPLAALDRVFASVLDAGMTKIHVLADRELERAHSVRLHGQSVHVILSLEVSNPAPDAPDKDPGDAR